MQPPTFREIIASSTMDSWRSRKSVVMLSMFLVTVLSPRTALVVIDQRRARGQVFVAKLDGSWRQNEAAIYL